MSDDKRDLGALDGRLTPEQVDRFWDRLQKSSVFAETAESPVYGLDLAEIATRLGPWTIAPRGDGKYYGTAVIDANGVRAFRVWYPGGEPSRREKEYFGPDWTPEAWAEYCSDDHWESAVSLAVAELAIALRNHMGVCEAKERARMMVNLLAQFEGWIR